MDYYSILGVPKNASQDQIKKAYKKQSMKHHPDRGGNEEEFKKVNEAYQTLGDAQKRAAYDNPQPQFNFNSGGNPFGGGFEDIFAHAFGAGFRQGPRHQRNSDVTIAARISLLDAIHGKKLLASYRLRSGREETVDINIPAGVRDDDTMRFAQLGDDSFPGPRGNLFVKIKIDPIHNWKREGNNLYTSQRVNALDLILGGVTLVNTIEGKTLELRIPAGTKAGTSFSISDHGIPDINTKQRGKILVKIEAEIPKITDTDILSKLKEIRDSL
jgi:DnaJ-class molecular chaperone